MAQDKNINHTSADEEIIEGIGPVLSYMADKYCENLVNPAEEKRIDPKKLYITLGSTFAGALLLFFFLGWLLCYCPLKTTGVPVDEFIREYNSIVSDGDIIEAIDTTVSFMGEQISATDVTIAYPDFSDMDIPEGANLEKGVYLCDDNIFMQADVVGGNIQKLTVAVSDKCHHYDVATYSFGKITDADFDYSALPYYAAPGRARLAFYRFVYNEGITLPDEFTLNDCINFCMGMRNGAYYSFADAEDYSPDQTYFEYCDNAMFYFTPNDFEFTVDTRDKVLSGEDNGLYRFYDSIFGEKKEKAPAADTTVSTQPTEPTVGTTVPVTSGSEAAQ